MGVAHWIVALLLAAIALALGLVTAGRFGARDTLAGWIGVAFTLVILAGAVLLGLSA